MLPISHFWTRTAAMPTNGDNISIRDTALTSMELLSAKYLILELSHFPGFKLQNVHNGNHGKHVSSEMMNGHYVLANQSSLFRIR